MEAKTNGGSNGRTTRDDRRDEARESRDSRVDGGDESYSVRDCIFLEEQGIAAGKSAEIVIRPEKDQGRSLVHRIIMHKSCATKLALMRMVWKGREIKGSASCEIFLAEYPNWTPQKIYISEDEPLRLFVRNPVQVPLYVIGCTVIWRRENDGR